MSYTLRQYAFLYGSFMAAMFAGASIVHAVLAPDLRLPPAPQLVARRAAEAAAEAAEAATAAGRSGAAAEQAGGAPSGIKSLR